MNLVKIRQKGWLNRSMCFFLLLGCMSQPYAAIVTVAIQPALELFCIPLIDSSSVKMGYNLIQHEITDNLSMVHSMDHDHDLMCKWDTGHRTLSWSSGLTLITYSWECTQLTHMHCTFT